MVKILLTITLCLSFFGVSAKTYFSAMHGDWEDPSNWFETRIGNPACEIPGPGDYVLVYHKLTAHHDILIGPNGTLALIGIGSLSSDFNLTILQGGRFQNFSNVTVKNMLVSGLLQNLGKINLDQIRIGGKLDNGGQIYCNETLNVDRSGRIKNKYGSFEVGPYVLAAHTISGEAMVNGLAPAHSPLVYNRSSSQISCSIIIPVRQ